MANWKAATITLIVLLVLGLGLGLGLGFGLNPPAGSTGLAVIPSSLAAASNGKRRAGAAAGAPGALLPPSTTGNPLVDALNRASAQSAASKLAAKYPLPAGVVGGVSPSSAALAAVDQTGKLAPVFATSDSAYMAHAMPSVAKPADFATAFHDGSLADYDPVAAAQVDKALTMSGLPPSFHMSAADAEAHKRREILRSMQLDGNPNASLEDILAASPAMLVTQDLIRQQLTAQRQLDMGMVIDMPRRFMSPGDPLRPPLPIPALSPTLGDSGPITPGQENLAIALQCAGGAAGGPAYTF